MVDVYLYLELEYEYGSYDWINCRVKIIEKLVVLMYLEVCLNEIIYIFILNFIKLEMIDDVFVMRNENCFLERK